MERAIVFEMKSELSKAPHFPTKQFVINKVWVIEKNLPAISFLNQPQ